MKRRTAGRLLAALCAGVVVGCGDSSTSPNRPDPVDDLVARLSAAGLSVVRAGQIEQPFFGVRGAVLAAGTTQVQVFVFPLAAAAAAAAASVSPDGTTIGTTIVTWVAPPHFYRSDRLLVLYVGSEPTALSALMRVLGPPFAGG
jgi:hypothetical protein